MYDHFWKLGLANRLRAMKEQQIIALRMAKLMFAGPADDRGPERAASGPAAATGATTTVPGGPPRDVVRGHRRKVRTSKKGPGRH